jgi:hypothetical protein
MADTINMPTTEGGKVAGLFHDEEVVERALTAAEQLGYDRTSIHVVTPLDDPARAADETPAEPVRGDVPGEGPWRGALIGAVIGALVGVMTGLLLNGAGVISLNPLLAALVAGLIGGVPGFYLGSLLGVSLPEWREKSAQTAVEHGAFLLSVSPRSADDAERLKREWGRLGAEVLAE